MVESNNDEERVARIERILEQLQRESAALKKIAAAEVFDVVVETAPSLAAILPHAQPLTARR